MSKRTRKDKDPDFRPIEDIDDWEVVGRGGGVPTRVAVRITVRLDRETYEALEDAADLEGVDIVEFAKRAIGQAAAAVRSPASNAGLPKQGGDSAKKPADGSSSVVLGRVAEPALTERRALRRRAAQTS